MKNTRENEAGDDEEGHAQLGGHGREAPERILVRIVRSREPEGDGPTMRRRGRNRATRHEPRVEIMRKIQEKRKHNTSLLFARTMLASRRSWAGSSFKDDCAAKETLGGFSPVFELEDREYCKDERTELDHMVKPKSRRMARCNGVMLHLESWPWCLGGTLERLLPKNEPLHPGKE